MAKNTSGLLEQRMLNQFKDEWKEKRKQIESMFAAHINHMEKIKNWYENTYVKTPLESKYVHSNIQPRCCKNPQCTCPNPHGKGCHVQYTYPQPWNDLKYAEYWNKIHSKL